MEMIRYAKKSDISRLAEIEVFGKRTAYRSVFQDDIGSFHDLQVLPIIQEYQRNSRLLDNILVYDDGIVKGIIGGKEPSESSEAKTIELYGFYVDPFFKGQGIGRALLEHFCLEAERKGKEKICLWVLEDNTFARRFYELNGYVYGNQKAMIEGTQVVDLYYEKRLVYSR